MYIAFKIIRFCISQWVTFANVFSFVVKLPIIFKFHVNIKSIGWSALYDVMTSSSNERYAVKLNVKV